MRSHSCANCTIKVGIFGKLSELGRPTWFQKISNKSIIVRFSFIWMFQWSWTFLAWATKPVFRLGLSLKYGAISQYDFKTLTSTLYSWTFLARCGATSISTGFISVNWCDQYFDWVYFSKLTISRNIISRPLTRPYVTWCDVFQRNHRVHTRNVHDQCFSNA